MNTKLKHAEPGAKPPPNLLDARKWADFRAEKSIAHFLVEEADQEPRKIAVSRNMRLVLEGLMRGPVLAASRCRISDQVLPLRRDKGLNIQCTIYQNGADGNATKYGVYTLQSKVCRVERDAS